MPQKVSKKLWACPGGRNSASRTASSSPEFHQVCGVAGAMAIRSPGPRARPGPRNCGTHCTCRPRPSPACWTSCKPPDWSADHLTPATAAVPSPSSPRPDA
jgi:hypothetical protein